MTAIGKPPAKENRIETLANYLVPTSYSFAEVLSWLPYGIKWSFGLPIW